MRVLLITWEDLRADRLHFFCAAALIAAMVGPLLLLFGIKVGVITVLLGDLRDRPSAREVVVTGDHTITPEQLAQVRAWPGVAFAAGQSTAMLTGGASIKAVTGGRYVTAQLVPTGAGDPLTRLGADLGDDEVILSDSLARRLDAMEGGEVALDLERFQPFDAVVEPRFRIKAVLPREAAKGSLVLLREDVIDLLEAFGRGYAIPHWDVAEGLPLSGRIIHYEKIRLYAKTLTQVAPLEARLESELLLTARSEAGFIESMLRFEHNLNAALAFVTSAGVVGLFCALAALFWSAIARKRLTISMLSLMGAQPWQLAVIPVLQAGVVSFTGFLGGLAIYQLLAPRIDAWFADSLVARQEVTLLPLADALGIFAGLLIISFLAAGVAGYSAMRVDPALAIREN